MKTLNLFFKFFLLGSLSIGSVASYAQTAEPFIKAFEQLEAVAKDKGTNARAYRRDLYQVFLMAKDLPAQQFNEVVYELLLSYTKHPQLRGEIQGVLSQLGKGLNLEIFNSRQQYETPLLIARSLTWGFTLVFTARLFIKGPMVLRKALKGSAEAPTFQTTLPPAGQNPVANLEGAKTVGKASMGQYLLQNFKGAYANCSKSTACSNWSAGILAGGVIEGVSYLAHLADTEKVHPLEALRMVQAHIGCEMHWNIYDIGQTWDQEKDWKVLFIKTESLEEQVKMLEKSYGALHNSYRSDLSTFKKYYPKSQDWWKLASTVVDDQGRTCEQISTEAMDMDITKIKENYSRKFANEIRSEVMKKLSEEQKAQQAFQDALRDKEGLILEEKQKLQAVEPKNETKTEEKEEEQAPKFEEETL